MEYSYMKKGKKKWEFQWTGWKKVSRASRNRKQNIKHLESQQRKMMKTSQDRQGQQEYGGMMLQMSARWRSVLWMSVGAYPRVSDVRQRKRCLESLLDTTAFPPSLLTIWIFCSSYWSPNWRNQMVLRCLTVPYKTGAGFTDSHSWSSKVVSQTLVMFYQTP